MHAKKKKKKSVCKRKESSEFQFTPNCSGDPGVIGDI